MPEFQIHVKKASEMEVALRFKLLTQLTQLTQLTLLTQWHICLHILLYGHNFHFDYLNTSLTNPTRQVTLASEGLPKYF